MISNKIYYIYPFTPGPQDSIELRYSLRSFEQYVKDDYIIVITGDRKPNWLNIENEKIKFITVSKSSREKDKIIYNNIEKVINHFSIKKFIKLSDDNIFLQNFKYSDIDKNPYVHSYMVKKRPPKLKINYWQNKLWDTIEFSKSLNLPNVNYESHVPQCFYSDKLIECDKIFNISSGEHLLATAYYNFFHKEIINKTESINEIRWGSWGKKPNSPEPLPNHLFGNQDHKGLPFTLPIIKNLFSKKSKFEV